MPTRQRWSSPPADISAAAAGASAATTVPGPQPGPNGGMIHTVNIGYDSGVASYMRFVPTNLTIKAGDTVMWKQNSAMTPHTVTLLPNQGAPAPTVVEPQGNGPPTVKLNPAILAPAGGTSYAGSGYYNSGFLLPLMDPTPAPRDYALTFTAPGTYTYVFSACCTWAWAWSARSPCWAPPPECPPPATPTRAACSWPWPGWPCSSLGA